MKQYLTKIEERRSLLNRIIPQLGMRTDKRGLDWGAYFASHHLDATLLAYDIRAKDPSVWNANNVMARQTVRDVLKGKLSGELPASLRKGSAPLGVHTDEQRNGITDAVELNKLTAEIEDLRAIVRKLQKQLESNKTVVKLCPNCGFNIAVLNAAYRIALKHGGTNEE